MGFRYRKSIKMGPVRVNFSKSGVGYSIGGKFARYTKKANGGTRTTYTLPGTGLSYVTETSAKKAKSAAPAPRPVQPHVDPILPSYNPEPVRESTETYEPVNVTKRQKFCPKCQREMELSANRCPHCGKRWDSSSQLSGVQIAAIVIILILILIAFTGCGKAPETQIPTLDPSVLESIQADPEEEEEFEIPTATGANIEGIFAGQGVTGTGKGEKHSYIYNSNTGVFHEPGCRYVKEMDAAHKVSFTATREDAISKGYDPCDHCNP